MAEYQNQRRFYQHPESTRRRIFLWGGAATIVFSMVSGFLFSGPVSAAVLGLGGGALILFYYAHRRFTRAKLRRAVDGIFPDQKLSLLLEDPECQWLRPVRQMVTTVFVDFGDFSEVVEMQAPALAVGSLKRLRDQIAHTVHNFGGVVNKTYHEGVLCYFPEEAGQPKHNHAETAVRFAKELQIQNARIALEGYKKGLPVHPLRIGIDTSLVFVGDIGEGDRIDLALFGRGVHTAKRMQALAEAHSIVLSKSTREQLRNSESLGVSLHRRLIPLSVGGDGVEAYDCNGFTGEAALKKEIAETLRSSTPAARKETRWELNPSLLIADCGSGGRGRVLNFSESGLAVQLDRFLGKGLILEVRLDREGASLEKEFIQNRLYPLICEVRWGVPYNEHRFTHGLLIKNLSRKQKKLLSALLMKRLQGKSKITKNKFTIRKVA